MTAVKRLTALLVIAAAAWTWRAWGRVAAEQEAVIGGDLAQAGRP